MLMKGILMMSDSATTRSAPTQMGSLSLVPSSPSAEPAKGARVDDAGLIRQAQQGDTAAFEELVRQYDRAVLRLAVHLTGSHEDAQDIYQEAFLRA
jgi:RNA polymerase sigma-70 factor, ECF subfamily